jgi:hypothetical protein
VKIEAERIDASRAAVVSCICSWCSQLQSSIQAAFDLLSSAWQQERAESQMTLGSLIAILKEFPPDMEMQVITGAHSYRGYYEDLAFDVNIATPGGPVSTQTVALNLEYCESLLNQTFTGYKGGDFQMHAKTPVWVAHYGCCGMKIKEITDEGLLKLAEDNE